MISAFPKPLAAIAPGFDHRTNWLANGALDSLTRPQARSRHALTQIEPAASG